jgi:hypothetical protein
MIRAATARKWDRSANCCCEFPQRLKYASWTSAVVYRVCAGQYILTEVQRGSVPPPKALRYFIQFYDDFKGEPGVLLDPPNIVPADVHETLVDFLPDFIDPDDFIFGSGNGTSVNNYREATGPRPVDIRSVSY